MNENSNFWLNELEDINDLRKTDNFKYLMKLASYKNSISNFVRIMSGRNDIKVKFNADDKSFTDGKLIVIGSDISNGNIDVSVGVALHESAHIVKTDMDYFKNFWSKVPSHLNKLAKTKNYKPNEISDLSTDVLNYVEDRYIDNWAYENSPGYRGYYDKLYEKYWHNECVSNGLKSCFFRTRNIESYKFRLINLTNENSDLDALPGLREIHEILDVVNIDRLDTQEKRGKLSLDIVKIVIENLGENLELDYMDSLEKKEEEEKGGTGEKPENGEPTDNTDESKGSGEQENPSDDLKNQLKEQLDFLKGNVSKSQLTNEESDILDNIEKSETLMSSVGGTDGIPIIPCVVVKKINREIINSGIIPMAMSTKPSEDCVNKGVLMGTILGKRLQIRGETKVTKFNRLFQGKIDKRLLSGLGYNNSNVFYNINLDTYKKAFIHISVDSSQSMRESEKWEQVMTCTVAICKAASMVNNLHVCVTFRSTSNKSSGSSIPFVVVAYDSRVDKFSKISQLFPSFCPNGATPEGLSFQSILNLIPKSSHELDVYFLNFSDGEPYFSYGKYTYSGISAARHTKRQIDKIKSTDCEIISYFVGHENNSPELFKLMYGNNAKIVNVTDVSTIAKTLNEKFLEKSKD